MVLGLEILLSEHVQQFAGRRLGLVTHPAAVDHRLRSAVEIFQATFAKELKIIFGPEHGLLGHAQDLEAVEERQTASESSFPKVVSLYGTEVSSLRPSVTDLNELDVLIIDLQDIGSRYYTFQATMLYCLEAALPLGIEVWVLDRPNPLGGLAVEGPALRAGYESFVGCHDIAIRHGLTIGELALLYASEKDLPKEGLKVIKCQGWQRSWLWGETGVPWVLPSPNMPTPDTALVYPGQCLLEGTNLSEGRGTTRPFELCGAPSVCAEELARRLNAEDLPGSYFRPCSFKPGFQKWAGILCGGVQLHVTDPQKFFPVRTGYAVVSHLRQLAGETFRWRTETYEFVDDPIAIDLLFGSDRERLAMEAGVPWRDIAAIWEPEEQAFSERRRSCLLY